MHVIGVTMIKNEADVIAGTLLHQLGQGIEAVYVLDRGSVDGTAEIVRELADKFPAGAIRLRVDSSPGYRQAELMTDLAMRALLNLQGRPFWLVPFDADELWWSARGSVAMELGVVSPGVRAVNVPMHNYRTTALDPVELDPFLAMNWREAAINPLGKVAVRWDAQCQLHQGSHGLTRRGQEVKPAAGYGLGISHFQYRSVNQFVGKVLVGAESYLAEPDGGNPEHGVHWRSYRELADRLGEGALFEVYRQHFHALSPVDSGLVHDPAPYAPIEV